MNPNNDDNTTESTSEDVYDNLSMSPEHMLELAQQTAERLVSRVHELPNVPAWDGEFRHELFERFEGPPPEQGTAASAIIDRAINDILPLGLSLDHPRSFGLVSSATTWPGVLADFISSAFSTNVAIWLIASGPSAIELIVVDWMRSRFGLPESAGGLLTSGGSAAALDAFVAAREAAGSPMNAIAYMSDQTHSAQIRAAKIVGIHPDRIRLIPCDQKYRLDFGALVETVATDKAAGLHPIAIAANAGTSNTGMVDPLDQIADFCEAEGIWFHVDAAYGGFAVLTELGKQVLSGIERTDSIGTDAHKWLFQPYEAGCLLLKDTSTLENAFSFQHDVLRFHLGSHSSKPR